MKQFYWLFLILPWLIYSETKNVHSKTEEMNIKKTSIYDEISKPQYTINFDNIPIKEFLKYISKIAHLNVIYNEEDLENFNVTIVSEEQTNINNILSILVQILRVHNLNVIQEEHNLLIHKNADVKQIPAVVSDEHPLLEEDRPAPIITRVFRVQHSNPHHIANLISPMLSKTANIEVSLETRQLIITDTASSIQTISTLLSSIDTPDSLYAIDMFQTNNIDAEDLVLLAKKIIPLLVDDTPCKLIPHGNTIYIVSTPFIIVKITTILEDLDKNLSFQQPLQNNLNVAFVQPKQKSASALVMDLKEVAKILEKTQDPSLSDFITTLNSAAATTHSNIIVLFGHVESIERTKTLIQSNDQINNVSESSPEIFLYHTQHLSPQELQSALSGIAGHIQQGPFYQDMQPLLESIHNLHIIPNAYIIQFVAPPPIMQQLKSLLPILDHPDNHSLIATANFLVYKTKMPQLLLSQLTYIASLLPKHTSLTKTISSAHYSEELDLIIFVGDPQNLEQILSLLKDLDQDSQKSQEGSTLPHKIDFFIYKIQALSYDNLLKNLQQITKNIPNMESLHNSIKRAKYLPESQSIVFSGYPEDLHQIEHILHDIDQTTASTTPLPPQKTEIFVYKVQHLPATQIQQELQIIAENAQHNDPSLETQYLIMAITSMKEIPGANSLQFNVSSIALKNLKSILTILDSSQQHTSGRKPLPQADVYIYHLQSFSHSEIIHHLKQIVQLSPENQKLEPIVNNAYYIPESRILIFSGDPSALKIIQEILNNIDFKKQLSSENLTDVSSHEFPASEHTEIFIYQLHYISPQKLINMLNEIANHASSSHPNEKMEIIDAIHNIKALPNSRTIQIIATPSIMEKLKNIIATLDTQEHLEQSEQTSGIPVSSSTGSPDIPDIKEESAMSSKQEIFIYQLHHISPEKLMNMLNEIANHASTRHPHTETELINAIHNIKALPNSRAVQIIASSPITAKLSSIIATLDTKENAKKPEIKAGTDFLVYKIKHLRPKDLLDHLKHVVSTVHQNKTLLHTIAQSHYIEGTESIVFSGNASDLETIHLLLQQIDVPSSFKEKETPQKKYQRNIAGYQLYHPKYVPGTELITMTKQFERHLALSGLLNSNLSEVVDNLAYMDNTNTIVLTGTESSVQQVWEWLIEFDQKENVHSHPTSGVIESIAETSFLTYKLQYQPGNIIVTTLNAIKKDLLEHSHDTKQELTKSISSIQWIEPTNSLIATGDAKTLTSLKELIRNLDQPQKQIFLEVLVVETFNSTDFEIGLRTGSQGSAKGKLGWSGGNTSPAFNPPDNIFSTSTAPTFFDNLSKINGVRVPGGADIPNQSSGFLGVIGDIVWHKGQSYGTIASLLNALYTKGSTTVILAQRIIVPDNQEAELFSGDNIPFTGALTSTVGQNITTNANIEYRNVGTAMKIKPSIGDNNRITLDIEHEISEEVNQGGDDNFSSVIYQAPSATNINGIRTSKSKLKTRAYMPDKHFLVLSGTMRDFTIRNISGIPCLGGIPGIGALFSYTQKRKTTRGVVIFLKPYIIDSDKLYDEITRRQEFLYSNPDFGNEDDVQKGLNLIRTPEDEELADAS